MALILVVEPDRTRAAQVASLMRNHLRAQTIVVDCALRARGALVYSIPDVILLSTLISTQDEAGITSELRGLGDAAAHVQMVTIPMLADAPAPPASRRGLLASFLTAKPSIETAGCEADLFAQQVSDYLDLAASTRKAVPVQPEQPEQPLELILVPPSDFLLPAESDFLAEPVADTSDVLPLDFDAPEDDTCLAATEDDTSFDAPEVATCLIAAEDDTRLVAAENDTCLAATEDDTCLVAAEDDTPLVASEDDTPLLAPEDDTCLVMPEAADYASVIAPEAVACYEVPADHAGDFTTSADIAYFSAPEDGDCAGDTTEDDGWISISLESPVEQHAEDALEPAPAAKTRKKDKKKLPAVQDEWGLFNPDQCGFPALLARLNELEKRASSDSEDAVTTVRVGGY